MGWLKTIDQHVANTLAMVIRGYQLTLSPWFGRRCRFLPTCSQYGIDALRTHGAVTGCWLTVHRLLRCQPGCEGGYDPIPSAPQPHEHN